MEIVSKLIFQLLRPSPHPIRKVTTYYAVVVGAVFAAANLAPETFAHLTAGPSDPLSLTEDVARAFSGDISDSPLVPAITVGQLLVTLVAAFMFMIPISWGYMSARMKVGFDQSVVQTMLILPIAVAGIVVVVQDSIALAFSLAGIVAAVRFRNALQDTADALYIFCAIGVGLACGVGTLQVAAVVSVFFNYIVLVLWHCDYGVCFDAGPVPEYSSGNLLTRAGQMPIIEAGAKRKKKKKKKRSKRHVIPAQALAGEGGAAAQPLQESVVAKEPG